MSDSQTKKDNKTKELPKSPDGSINWMEYYKDITPKIKEEGRIDEKKNMNFAPEYSDELNPSFQLADKEVFQKMDDEGNIEYIDSLPQKDPDSILFDQEKEIDTDFLEEDGMPSDDIDEQEKTLYQNALPNEGDLFLIIIDEDDEIIDKLITVDSIQKKENLIHFKDEEENDIILFLNEDSNIILESNEYKFKIIDFEKIKEIDIKELNDDIPFLTKDIYQDVELDIEEKEEKVYSLQERKESLITELITLFSAHNNTSSILNICDLADNYISMIDQNKNKTMDYSEKLPFLKEIKKENYKLPNWIIPIVDNVKRLYNDIEGDDETIERTVYEDNTYIDFEEELRQKYEIFFSETNTYKNYSKSLNSFTPFYNKGNGINISHEGHYIRDCNDINPCHGLNGTYIFEINKTRKPFILPLLNETILPTEKVSITGFYTIPHQQYDLTFKKDSHLSLFENSILSSYKYSYIPFNKRLIHSEIVPHIIGPDTEKGEFIGNLFHSFLFNPFVNKENLKDTLYNNLPTIKDIIQNIPSRIRSNIFNYDDLRKTLLPYNITYGSMDNENKKVINTLIRKNTRRYITDYNKSIQRKIIKPVKQINKLLSTEDRIQLSWDYIQTILSHPLKNNYIEKFIQRFSREPFENEDQNSLYQKDSNRKLICKHYLYSAKVHNNEDAFLTLKEVFGGPPNDGTISCICCGEYLCPEDFSTLEGFSEGAPKNTREILETSESIKALSDKQVDIKKKIHKISSLLSIELNDYDKQTIINYFDSINNDDLIDFRYKNGNTFKKHPSYKGIKKKYKFIKPAKTPSDKMNNKKNMALLDKEINVFQKYLIDGNELFIITFLILFHLQVSYPPYDIQSKVMLNLWDTTDILKYTWPDLSNLSHTKMSMKTINTVFSLLTKVANTNQKDIFWKNVSTLFNEGEKYKELVKAKGQFLQTASYVLRNAKIRSMLKDYYQSQNDIKIAVYLKEVWPSYRPLNDNKIIIDINNKVNKQLKDSDLSQYLLKKGGNIIYENISTIQSIKNAYSTPKYKLLEIPYSDIMKNESYKRLLEYSIHLHGVSKEIPTLNLLIDRLINTIENSLEIEKIMESIGWDKNKKSLKKVNYIDLRRVLINEIQNIFQQKDPEEEKIMKSFNYIKINTMNGMLLNSYPKRYYSYKTPIVFPDQPYPELKKIYDTLQQKGEKQENDLPPLNIIQSLFKMFCFDDNGNINKKISHDDFILNIVADPSFEREVICQKDIDINEENFYKILKYNTERNKLPFIIIEDKDDYMFEKRLHDFITKNKLLQYEGKDTYHIMEQLHQLYGRSNNNTEAVKKDYRNIFNTIEDYKNATILKIKNFFMKSSEESVIRQDQLKYYKKTRGPLDKIDIYLNNYLDNSTNIENNISNIVYIIGRLSNSTKDRPIGTILSDFIPKQWKLSETNIENIQNFINNKEFLLHNNIFLDSKKYEGFYKYVADEKHSVCFQGLFDFIKEFYIEGIYDLAGNNNTYYTETYSKMFMKFYFVTFFEHMIDYIESLYDEQSISSQKANELFLLLEEKDELELKDSIENCSQLLFDLLMHFLDEYSDTNWIFQFNDISDKLSRQKEIEKQNIINDLEGKTADERQITVIQQKTGIINWFQDSSIANLERLRTSEYEEQLNSERLNKVQEVLLQNQSEIEVAESFGVNINHLLGNLTKVNEDTDEGEIDQGYDQRDTEREGEGEDDPDEDGDYREN